MNWDDVMAFRVIAEERSLSRAAQRLQVSGPSLSNRLSRLERQLRVRLLDRTTRRVDLTPAGASLLRRAMELEALWQLTQTEIASAATRPASTALCLAVVDLRPEQIDTAVSQVLPDVKLQIKAVGSGARAVGLLRRGGVDLVVGYRHPYLKWHEARDLGRATIVREQLWAALPVRHRLAAAPAVALQELAEDPWIEPVEPEVRRSVDAICAAAGFRPRYEHTSSNHNDIRDLLAGGRAVNTSSPCWQVNPSVVLRPLAQDPPTASIVLLWSPPALDDHRVELIVAALRAWYADLARRRNPIWWGHILAHPGDYPGIATA